MLFFLFKYLQNDFCFTIYSIDQGLLLVIVIMLLWQVSRNMKGISKELTIK